MALWVALGDGDAVLAVGGPGSGLAAPEGGTLLQADLAMADFAAADAAARAILPHGEVWFDRAAGAFKARAKAATQEMADRDDAQAALANLNVAIANWGTLTAAQKDQAALLTLRCVRALIRLLLR